MFYFILLQYLRQSCRAIFSSHENILLQRYFNCNKINVVINFIAAFILFHCTLKKGLTVIIISFIFLHYLPHSDSSK